MEDKMPKREQHYVFGNQAASRPAYGVRSGYSAPPYGGAKQIPKLKAFNVGDRVSHLTFGAGTISAVTPMGGDVLYDVEFDTAGHKRLMGSYAKLTAIN
jgi:DNA helicase-2/ATP-dependent DNA helicase PcrA